MAHQLHPSHLLSCMFSSLNIIIFINLMYTVTFLWYKTGYRLQTRPLERQSGFARLVTNMEGKSSPTWLVLPTSWQYP